MFTLEIDTFEALIDLENAVENELARLASYRHWSVGEEEAFNNLKRLQGRILAMRVPVTEQRRLAKMLEVTP